MRSHAPLPSRGAWPALLGCLSLASTAPAAEPIEWRFDSQREIIAVSNLEPGRASDGQLAGQTSWDPHVSLRLPADGIDARRFTRLTVRLYSSEKADLLDVYYQSPDKRWCLGGKFPVDRGWATYRIDLTNNRWRETTSGDDSKRWGGPAGRVSSLRIDPGNQADRWVALDSVTLQEPGPGWEEGVTAEPRGTARTLSFHAPDRIDAGETLRVTAEFETEPPRGRATGTFRILLRREATILRQIERTVDLSDRRAVLNVELPISPYWNPGPARLDIACYELDPAGDDAAPTRELTIANDRVGAVHPPAVDLRPVGGDPAIHVDGKPFPGYLYVSHGGLHLDHHREIARAGVHLYADWFGSSTASDLGHVAPDRHDYSEYDRYFAAILDADPQARFLPHIGVTGPAWWQKAHPEELCQFEDGTRGPTSFASELWRRAIGEDLRGLIAHLRRAPYADRILGYMFYNGYTAEWQMWGTWKESRCDYSAPALRAFRAFLAARHGTDARLQAAWADPAVTLRTATMPSWNRRRPPGSAVLRDPATERQAVDFYTFISEMDADALLHVARIVREATGGTSLVGTYYAYLTAHGINQQDSGHLAARRVFDSPDIDFLMSPPNYWYRKPGEACTFMSATDSLRLRGKLWLDESDHRTHLTDPGAGYGRASNLEETRGVFWRELAHVMTKRAAVSWFDMSGGWFSHPRILADLNLGERIARESLARRAPFAPEIAVFVDPQSFLWMRSTAANAALVLHQVVTMPQSGAPWDFLLLDDIADPRLPRYKLCVFLNAFHVDPPKREAIHAKLRRDGATALFVYAPGYLGPDGASLNAMRALTGIAIGRDERQGPPQLSLDPADPLARGLPTDRPIGAQRLVVSPIFHADDPDARVAGHMLANGKPGLALKRMDGWTSVYSGAMQLPQGLMRNLARAAGVHIWIESDDALYTDGQSLGLHAASDGTKTIRLPAPRDATDALTGKPVPANGQTLRLPMRRAETILLRLQPGRIPPPTHRASGPGGLPQ